MKLVQRSVMLRSCVLLTLFCYGMSLIAEEKPNINESSISLTATTRNELKLGFDHSVTIDNIKISTSAGVSPVSINGSLEARLTPVAFFQLLAGASLGSGWNIPLADGLRVNNRVNTHDSQLSGGAFEGLVWSLKGGATVQADLAAFVPGKWTHVVFQSTHVLQYRALTTAKPGEAWLYEADDGENMNGWNYYGNYFLGYQMPFFVSLIGFLAEEDLYLYTADDRDLWGDDISRWTFGPMLSFKISESISATALVQVRTRRNYTDATKDYEFYQDRTIANGDERHIEFYRALASVKMILE